MDGFKDTTRMKYMTGGPVKKAMGGMATAAAPTTSGSKIITPEDKAKYAAEINTPYRETKPLGPRAQAQNARMGPVKRAKGGVMKKGNGGGVFNEKGTRATWDEVAAEGRRMEGRKPPVEGISTRPTDSSGRRMTDKELGMTRGGVDTAKKTMKKATGGGVFPEGGKRPPKPMPTNGYTAGPAGSSGGLTSAYVDAMQKREDAAYQARMVADAKAKKATGVRPSSAGGSLNPTAPTRGPSTAPAFNDRPMIRRKTGGLTAMPKGKC